MSRQDKIDRIREPEVLGKIAELVAMGITNSQISQEIENKFGFKPAPSTVESITKQFAITSSIFLEKDKDMKERFKTALFNLLDTSEENIKIITELRDEIREFLNMLRKDTLLEDTDRKRFNELLFNIQNLVKTLDNSINTQSKLLDLFNKEKTEVSFSTVQHAQRTLEELEELEKEGIIIIKDEYKSKKKPNMVS
jgi:Rad3-related DNA helicase